MNLSDFLAHQVAAGRRRIGQLVIGCLDDPGPFRFRLCHLADAARLAGGAADHGLDEFHGPDRARELSTWGDDGSYRFAKAQPNLRCGWVMWLHDAAELRHALDGFYPAAVGLWRALDHGGIEVQHLRDKLERQTGMYRFARNISNDGAQQLVRELCGPAHQCAKRILWQIDAATPLDDSEASRFDGLPPDAPAGTAIPLVCREACNHFVAQCRIVSKREFKTSEREA